MKQTIYIYFDMGPEKQFKRQVGHPLQLLEEKPFKLLEEQLFEFLKNRCFGSSHSKAAA